MLIILIILIILISTGHRSAQIIIAEQQGGGGTRSKRRHGRQAWVRVIVHSLFSSFLPLISNSLNSGETILVRVLCRRVIFNRRRHLFSGVISGWSCSPRCTASERIVRTHRLVRIVMRVLLAPGEPGAPPLPLLRLCR